MKTYLDCIPCFVRQTLEAARNLGLDDSGQADIMRKVLKALSELDFNQPPPKMKQTIDHIIAEKIGDFDPYRLDKERFNRMALKRYPGLKALIQESQDPWETALKLAIAGNIIDMGVYGEVEEEEITASIEESLKQSLPAGSSEKLKLAVTNAESILYIGDNAGEIVFDRLFIEMMPPEKITYVVRGKPVLNDVTMKDAIETGMTELVAVIDSGSDVPGIIPAESPPELARKLAESDLIIAKGQGNYETLGDMERDICFLFKAKCPIIARDSGVEQGKTAVIFSFA